MSTSLDDTTTDLTDTLTRLRATSADSEAGDGQSTDSSTPDGSDLSQGDATGSSDASEQLSEVWDDLHSRITVRTAG